MGGRNRMSSPLGVRGSDETTDCRDLGTPPDDFDFLLPVLSV